MKKPKVKAVKGWAVIGPNKKISTVATNFSGVCPLAIYDSEPVWNKDIFKLYHLKAIEVLITPIQNKKK